MINLNKLFNQALPHLLIIFGFILIGVVYNYPILEGKRLAQHDVIQAEAAARQLREYRQESGKISLWAPTMFSGMPAYLIYMDYPQSLTTKLGRWIVNLVPEPANHIFLYMLGFYLLVLLLGYDYRLGILGAAAFAFASYNIINIEAGHISKVIAVAFAPPLVASVILSFRGKFLYGGALSGLFSGIQLYANHIQITYYLGIALALYVLYELIQIFARPQQKNVGFKNFALASVILVVAGALAVGSHASRILTNYEYSSQSIRGKSELSSNKQSSGGTDKDYAFNWSYGQLETMTFLIPNFYGGGSNQALSEQSKTYKALLERNVPEENARSFVQQLPVYWGNQPFTSGPAYLGAIVCFLFVFGLLISKDPLKWWLLAVSVIFMLLSWGKNLEWFNDFFFYNVPLYNKFRAVTMILSVLQLFVVWMAVLGLQALLEKSLDKALAWKKVLYSLAVTGGLSLLFLLLGSSLLTFKTTEVVSERKTESGRVEKLTRDDQFKASLVQMTGDEAFGNQLFRALLSDRSFLQQNDSLRSLIFILLAAALLWAFLKNKLQWSYAFYGLCLLTLVDLWGVAARYLNSADFKKRSEYLDNFERSNADNQILEDKEASYRVADFSTGGTFQDAGISTHHQSIGGYHAAKLRRYQELIEKHLGSQNMAVYNMLNTKYFITPTKEGELEAQKNPGALGNAWFVDEYKIVKNADQEIKSLEKFDPAKTAFIDRRFGDQLKNLKIQKDSTASIRLTSYKPDELVYESQSKTTQLAVFSEIYYVNAGKSEWTAYLDGKAVQHLRANFVLRAMVIPPGKHSLRFQFDSPYFHTGERIALLCSLFLLAGIVYAGYRALKEQN